MRHPRARVISPRPSIERFVRSLREIEVARGGAGADLQIAHRILVRLHRRLGELVGTAGFDVLLARAVVLARRRHPSLARLTTGPEGKLIGTDDPVSDAADEAGTAIVAHFLELLVTLIGEDLTMRLVGDLRPGEHEEDGPR
jgi:hypothetical protein